MRHGLHSTPTYTNRSNLCDNRIHIASLSCFVFFSSELGNQQATQNVTWRTPMKLHFWLLRACGADEKGFDEKKCLFFKRVNLLSFLRPSIIQNFRFQSESIHPSTRRAERDFFYIIPYLVSGNTSTSLKRRNSTEALSPSCVSSFLAGSDFSIM